MGWLAVLVGLTLSLRACADGGSVRRCNNEISGDSVPYLASLQKITTGHVCSATMLTSTWLLTAAQCIVDRQGRPLPTVNYFVLVGTRHIGTHSAKKEGTRGWPNLFVVHPMFKTNATIDYDLAVIRLQSPMEFPRMISYVSLPEDAVPDQILKSRNCTAIGWAKTDKTDAHQKDWTLIVANLQLVETGGCSEKLSRRLREHVHLCTYSECKDVCHGDSGSALVCQGVQVGVVSFVVACPDPYKAVFARVDTQLPWLLQVTSAAPAAPTATVQCAVCACALAALRHSFP